MVTRQEEWEHQRTMLHLCAHELDEVAMARFRQTHPKLVQVWIEFYVTRDAHAKKKKKKTSTSEASPSKVMVESSNSDVLIGMSSSPPVTMKTGSSVPYIVSSMWESSYM
jgi:hypothetical protein